MVQYIEMYNVQPWYISNVPVPLIGMYELHVYVTVFGKT